MEVFIVDFWHWWIMAVALVILEILAPTFFALWLAIAAFITGLVLLLVPTMSWEMQLVIFAVLSVASIVLWRFYYHKRPLRSDEPLLNRRGEQYIGRVFTLQEAIVDGFGKVKVDDSIWKIAGEDCPAGTKVKISNVNNVVFDVEILD